MYIRLFLFDASELILRAVGLVVPWLVRRAPAKLIVPPRQDPLAAEGVKPIGPGPKQARRGRVLSKITFDTLKSTQTHSNTLVQPNLKSKICTPECMFVQLKLYSQ